MVASLIVFAILYVCIATERIEKAVAAILGAGAVLFLHLISFEDAIKSIDMNVIFLLVGMMTCVRILGDTGFFEWVAISIAKKARGNALVIMALLLFATMVFSALLDNVTTIVLMAPVTILIAQILELPATLFIVLEAVASNIGGTATLIGDPPNIIIGSQAHLSFNDFLVHLAPGIALAGLIFIVTVVFFYRKKLRVPDSIRVRVLDAEPELAIYDRKKLIRALVVFGMIFAGFLAHRLLRVQAGIVALSGMAIILLVCQSESDRALKAVEWDVILFFIGLFIVIGSLERNGVLDILAEWIMLICGKNLFLSCLVILWGSAILSAVLDNIPFVMAMMPLVQKLIVANGGEATGSHPLFWALAMGACLGGNGTLIGASANIVAAKIGEKNGYPITFFGFMKVSLPLMFQSLIVSTVYLWFRYFF